MSRPHQQDRTDAEIQGEGSMCGRYAFSRLDRHLLERLALEQEELPEGLEPRWNVAPGHAAAALRLLEGKRRLELLHWGIKHPARPIGLLINARAETAATLPAFRAAFDAASPGAASPGAGRCLLPCDGWYEWKREGRLRAPWSIRPAGETVLLAGLWQPALQMPDVPVARDSFTILTCPAAESIAVIHPRMPVVLPPALWNDWLAGVGDGAAWALRLQPWPAEQLECWEVGPEVNGTGVDHEGLSAPAAAVQGSLF